MTMRQCLDVQKGRKRPGKTTAWFLITRNLKGKEVACCLLSSEKKGRYVDVFQQWLALL